MKSGIFIIFHTLLALAASSQISKTDSLRKVGDLSSAILEYKKVYKQNPSNEENAYNLACALSLTGNIDSAFYYLKIGTESDSTTSPLTDPDFYPLTQTTGWSKFEDQQVLKIIAKYGEYTELELAKELWRMKIADQAFYYHLDVVRILKGNIRPVERAIWDLKDLINRQNVKGLDIIVEKHGFPRESDVGGNAANAAFLIVQHADIETQKRYLPILEDLASKGEVRWSSLALLIDRIKLRSGEYQIYGTQVYGKKDGGHYIKSLFEPEYVNQRRKEVGLGPIEDYVKRWGIVWDIEQKEK